MPGTRCGVAICNNSLEITKRNPIAQHIKYHRFPKDPDRRKLWIIKCHRQDKFNPDTSFICSEHFITEDYERDLRSELTGIPRKKHKQLLTQLAVPSINLNKRIPESIPQQSFETRIQDRKSRLERREQKKVVDNILTNAADGVSEGVSANTTETIAVNDNSFPSNDNSFSSAQANTSNISISTSSEQENEIATFKRLYEKSEKGRKLAIRRYSNLKHLYLKTKRKVADLKQTVAVNTASTRSLVKELKTLKAQKAKKDKLEEKCKSILESVFTESQIKLLMGKKKVTWGLDDLNKAFALRYFSKRAYVFLKKELKIPLPGISTLKQYASKINMSGGILTEILKIMKVVGTNKSDLEKLTVITYDEMKIKSQYEYDTKRDQVVGKHSQMQVVMARGLYANWKQPVYIGFDQKMTKSLLFDVIKSVHEAEYTVVATVCDMGGGNQGLWRELGVNINRNWFNHPLVTDGKIFCFADAPHALKLIRNWLIDTGFNLNDTKISIKPLETLLKLDNNEIKMCQKLTKDHLECTGPQRQNVKKAAEILSNSVSRAIEYLLKTKVLSLTEEEEYEYQETGAFIKIVNDWFDIFNSGKKDYLIPTKCAFGTNLTEQIAALDQMYTAINDMSCIGKSCNQVFQKAILISIKSLKDLFFDLKYKFDIEYILTQKLNQDCLENFFSQVRTRGGLDDHPTPLNALSRIRMIVLGKNPGILSNNCNTIDQNCDEYLVSKALKSANLENKSLVDPKPDIYGFSNSSDNIVSSPQKANPSQRLSASSISNSSSTSNAKRPHDSNDDEFTKLEENGLKYLAGWVAKKHFKSYPNLDLVDKEKDHIYTLPSWAKFLSYGGYTVPSTFFSSEIQKFNTVFLKYLPDKTLTNECNIVRNLSHKIFQENDLIPMEIIESFVKIRICIRMKYLNSIKPVPKSKECDDKTRKKAKKMKKIVK